MVVMKCMTTKKNFECDEPEVILLKNKRFAYKALYCGEYNRSDVHSTERAHAIKIARRLSALRALMTYEIAGRGRSVAPLRDESISIARR